MILFQTNSKDLRKNCDDTPVFEDVLCPGTTHSKINSRADKINETYIFTCFVSIQHLLSKVQKAKGISSKISMKSKEYSGGCW